MPELRPGKLPAALLRRLLQMGGPAPAEVLLPPAIGEDACAIAIRGGTLVAATDPITLTGNEIGGHAVVINANDVAVTGVWPRWFLAVVLLPPGTGAAAIEALFADMHAALARLEITLVGGHTEITAAVTQPVVVGQMLGFREDGRFVRTAGMTAGDAVLQIGPAPVEGAAVLA
ncbi:MAG: AIR synthase related protein, partial [Geminicoccaceae bacterium]